jgi:hypothetical protein
VSLSPKVVDQKPDRVSRSVSRFVAWYRARQESHSASKPERVAGSLSRGGSNTETYFTIDRYQVSHSMHYRTQRYRHLIA